MDMVTCGPEMAPDLAQAYNAAVRSVPHCFPVSADEFAAVLSPTDERDRNRKRLQAQTVLAATQKGAILGLAHLGQVRADEQGQPGPGVLRFFWYARGQRAVGAALLAAAEAQLRQWGVPRIQAFHYDYNYPFYHVQHAYLSAYLDHVQALLGKAGYHPTASQVNLDWPHFEPVPPASTDVQAEIVPEWRPGRATRPNLAVRAMRGEREVGICVCQSLGERVSAPEAQDWFYVQWLGIAEELRGQGLGRHLMQRALCEMYAVGYRHATICTIGDNYRAYLFYSNYGYRAADWTYVWERE